VDPCRDQSSCRIAVHAARTHIVNTCDATRVSKNPEPAAGIPAAGAHETPAHEAPAHEAPVRDIADVPALEVVQTTALHLMSAAAVHLGLAEDLPEHRDLDEARTLIDSLAGLLDAAVPRLGHHHAAPLRDGLKSLQLAFREASAVPDPPGEAPGERYTGPVVASPRGRAQP
jgi:hypothetical protein